MKFDKVVAVKFLGMAMTVGGMLASNWSGKKEQDKTLEEAAKKYFENQNKGS